MPDEPGRPEDTEPTSTPVGGSRSEPAAQLGRRVARRRGRRRRLILATAAIVVVLVVAVALVVPGGNDRTTKSTARRTTTTSSTTTTTSPPMATTVIPKSSNPVVALAQQYDGRYVGMYTNTTFNTTGPATLDVRIGPSAGTLAYTVDLNGDLFGGGANLVRRIEGTIKLGSPNAPVVTHTAAFGDVTAKLGSGLSIAFTAPDVPDPKVKTFELNGTLRSDTRGFDATFTVGFRDGRSAQGTVTVLCAPQGQRPSQVTTLCASK